MTRPVLLDLFCGAGGAAEGYHRAGFDVIGIDTRPQPRYPFSFYQADAMLALADLAAGRPWSLPEPMPDVIHASPPCQRYSSATKAWHREGSHPDLYAAVRRALLAIARPWAIENVIGAPYHHGVMLCGSMFGLGVQRHRIFETSHLIMADRQCRHTGNAMTVTGHTSGWWAGGARTSATAAEAARAMGIGWMTVRQMSQSVPPAYTEYIGRQLAGVI